MVLLIENILQYVLIFIMFAPLPLLLLSSPVQYFRDKRKRKKYYDTIKEHYDDPKSVSKEQLRDIFPDLPSEELTQIIDHLREEDYPEEN